MKKITNTLLQVSLSKKYNGITWKEMKKISKILGFILYKKQVIRCAGLDNIKYNYKIKSLIYNNGKFYPCENYYNNNKSSIDHVLLFIGDKLKNNTLNDKIYLNNKTLSHKPSIKINSFELKKQWFNEMNNNVKLYEILNGLKDKKHLIDLISRVLHLRERGNKLHGDILESAISSFINKKTDYHSIHTGKDFFRSKLDYDIIISENESYNNDFINIMYDIRLVKKTKKSELVKLCDKYHINYKNKIDTKNDLNYILYNKLIEIKSKVEHISLKCYGKGPLQLSTLSDGTIVDECFKYVADKEKITEIPLSILDTSSFKSLTDNDVIFTVIYDEKNMTFSAFTTKINILFDKVKKIKYYPRKLQDGKLKKYEIFKFFSEDDNYLFEIRYGKKDANALQRGLWTVTGEEKNEAFDYLFYNQEYSPKKNWLQDFDNFILNYND
ncbi:MAG: hypothetical protein ACLFPJ_06260 [Candidatus Woesearchaeota archaeon]